MRYAAMLIGSVLIAATSRADVVVLEPMLDNTLYTSDSGAVSNAIGIYIFSGFNSVGQNRRALIRFDVAGAVPAGSTVTAASFQLVNASGLSESHANTVHRVLASWGEGVSSGEGMGAPSTTNDATWIHRFYDSEFWSAPGGDFVATPSATTVVGPSGIYTWSSAGMVQDVQFWSDNPGSNFGWLVMGGENLSGSSKRFGSRENADASMRPLLTITFTPPLPPCPGDWDGDRQVNFADITRVLAQWGAPFDFADITTTLSNWGQSC